VDVNQLMANYCDSPVLVICEVEVGARRVGWGLVGGTAQAHQLAVRGLRVNEAGNDTARPDDDCRN
jgi:hypothetical protein